MLKKILISILAIYIVLSSAYFLNKIFPFMDRIFGPKQDGRSISNIISVMSTKECSPFSLGHIAGDKFRINARLLKSVVDVKIDENNLSESIAKSFCDRAGQIALIYYDSRPVAIASIESYDYSKPVGSESKEQPIVYAVMNVIKKLSNFPDNGYVVAVFDYQEKLMDFYSQIDTAIDKTDEDVISGNIDTIYYQVMGQDPSKTEVEYSSLKTNLDVNDNKEIAVLSVWTDKKLHKGVHYVSAFNLHGSKQNKETKRYSLFPITKIRRSIFNLFQVVDIDNDGYKETILRKERNGIDSFLIYKYDPEKDIYVELTSNKDAD